MTTINTSKKETIMENTTTDNMTNEEKSIMASCPTTLTKESAMEVPNYIFFAERKRFNKAVSEFINDIYNRNVTTTFRSVSPNGITLEQESVNNDLELIYNQYEGAFVTEEILGDTESEIGNTFGEAFAVDHFRMLDTLGVAPSTIDAERRIVKLEEDLSDLRYIWKEARHYSYMTPRIAKQLAKAAEFVKGKIANEIFSLDSRLGSDEIKELLNADVIAVSDKTPEDESLFDSPKDSYNKIHWNLTYKFWEDTIIELSYVMSLKPTIHTVNKLKAEYNKLWYYYRKGIDSTVIIKGATKVVDGKEIVMPDYKAHKITGGRMISKRHYSQIRYMISSFLADIARRPGNIEFWTVKAERDLDNLEKSLGKDNVAGENVPVRHVDMENTTDIEISDAFARMTGSIGMNENEMIRQLDAAYYEFNIMDSRKSFVPHPRITVSIESPEFDSTVMTASIGDIIAS